MSCWGLSVSMLTFIGPNGDSAVSSEKETCPANATCLFKQKEIMFPLVDLKRSFLEASRILSLRSILRRLKSESCPLATAVNVLHLMEGLIVMVALPRTLLTAALTLSSL